MLYGKNKPSPKKITAAKMFGKAYTSINTIAKVLRVEVATAEVYIIDAYCAGAPMVSIEKLAAELCIHSSGVGMISRVITDEIPTLRGIKDALHQEYSYNQIKVVLAGMIRDELYKIMS